MIMESLQEVDACNWWFANRSVTFSSRGARASSPARIGLGGRDGRAPGTNGRRFPRGATVVYAAAKLNGVPRCEGRQVATIRIGGISAMDSYRAIIVGEQLHWRGLDVDY